MAANHRADGDWIPKCAGSKTCRGLKDIMPDEYMEPLRRDSCDHQDREYVKSIREHNRQMIDARKKYNNTENIIERANGYWDVGTSDHVGQPRDIDNRTDRRTTNRGRCRNTGKRDVDQLTTDTNLKRSDLIGSAPLFQI